MKKILFVLCSVLMNHLIMAQRVPDLKWGNPISESKRITLLGIVGSDGSNTYTLKEKQGFFPKLIVELLDEKLNQVHSQDLELKFSHKSMRYEFMIYRQDELLLFTSFRNNKVKKNFLFVQHIDKKTLLPKGRLEKISEIDYSHANKWNMGNYNFSTSRDESKLLIYNSLPYEKGAKEKFRIHVYGDENKELWQKEVTLPETEEKYTIKDFSVDNNGNVQVVGSIYNGNKGLIDNYSFELLSFNEEGAKMTRYPIQLKDKLITDVTVSVNEKGEILCGGFYSSKSSYSIAGTFFMRINKETAKVEKQSFKPFSIDFITENMTERQGNRTKRKADKGKDIELYEYDLNEMILKDDGGIVLVGEQYYVKVQTYTSIGPKGSSTTSTVHNYYYNDIIVVNIGGDGDIEWAEKIAKRQVTTNDGGFYSSYYLTLDDNQLQFIFNDHIQNAVNPVPGKTRNFTGIKEGVVSLVTMNENGRQRRQSLFKTKDVQVIIRPKVCKQVGANTTIIYGEKRRVNQFGLLTF